MATGSSEFDISKTGTAVRADERPARSGFRWFILGLICAIYMMVAVDRANLGIALPAIKQEFGISNTQAGLFATLMFMGFAASTIPSSFLVRRFKPRTVMTIALILTALACYLIGTSGSTNDIKIYRTLLGIVEAAISVCCATTLNHWFSTRQRGTATGYFWGASKVGPVICPPLSVYILQTFGWRAIFQFFAAPIIVAALLWYLLVRDTPEQSKRVSAAELASIRDESGGGGTATNRTRKGPEVPTWMDRMIRLRPVSTIATSAGVFRSWNIIGNMIATIFIVGIFNTFLAWIPSYLLNAKHLPLTTVGFVAATPFAGAVVGNLAGGWLSDNLLGMRRKPLMMVGALFSAIAISGLILSPPSAVFTGIFLLVAGFVVGLGYPHFFAYPMGLATREVYPVAYGVTSIGSALGASLFPLAAGAILDAYSWDMLFGFLAVAAIVCLLVLITIDEPLVPEPPR